METYQKNRSGNDTHKNTEKGTKPPAHPRNCIPAYVRAQFTLFSMIPRSHQHDAKLTTKCTTNSKKCSCNRARRNTTTPTNKKNNDFMKANIVPKVPQIDPIITQTHAKSTKKCLCSLPDASGPLFLFREGLGWGVHQKSAKKCIQIDSKTAHTMSFGMV